MISHHSNEDHSILPLGSALPGGNEWRVDELWLSYASSNWIYVRLLGVYADANAWLKVKPPIGDKLHTLCINDGVHSVTHCITLCSFLSSG
jgi:hypothetical protein